MSRPKDEPQDTTGFQGIRTHFLHHLSGEVVLTALRHAHFRRLPPTPL